MAATVAALSAVMLSMTIANAPAAADPVCGIDVLVSHDLRFDYPDGHEIHYNLVCNFAIGTYHVDTNRSGIPSGSQGLYSGAEPSYRCGTYYFGTGTGSYSHEFTCQNTFRDSPPSNGRGYWAIRGSDSAACEPQLLRFTFTVYDPQNVRRLKVYRDVDCGQYAAATPSPSFGSNPVRVKRKNTVERSPSAASDAA